LAVPFGEALAVARDRGEAARLEPLADEVLRERVRLRVAEHALDLHANRFGIIELAARREREQLVVRHRAPEEIAEPRRELVIRERRVRAGRRVGFAPEQKLRRHEHGRDRVLQALPRREVEAESLVVDAQEALDLAHFDGPPERALDEPRENGLNARTPRI